MTFCCNPSWISASPPRIERSRLETANGALEPGIGLDLGKPVSRLYSARGAQNPPPSAWGTLETSGFARLRVVFRGFRRRFYGTNSRSRRETGNGASEPVIAPHEIPTVLSDFGVLDTQHLVAMATIRPTSCGYHKVAAMATRESAVCVGLLRGPFGHRS